MKVISTEKSQVFATRLARALKTTVVDVTYSRFPDGEHYLRTGDLDDETIIVGSVIDNDALVQLLLLIDACDSSENRLVIPYLAYARQDKRFHPGEPISIRAVAQIFSRGVSDITTVNIHDKDVLRYFSVPTRDISVARDLGEYINTLDLDNPLILSPDDGALAFARQVASVGGWDVDNLEKTRLSGVEVKMAPKQLCAKGRSVFIVDDIISTGGTIATAAGMLYGQGADNVYAACVHGVLTGGAYGRLMATGIRDVICSDTIERACSKLSAADGIAHALSTP
ncbi:ribose-phosphate diphosphokinase [uncultured Methanoregula sp.]|uniref:ribose-phosphate diphosphokinase n=1 Tax=uncultured Methanoregula sp. TaxID=1005933 RepID=UPI002AAACAC5|nr:ribose-phosphate diphosphokinase [uncultured Methanoregula sp.]